MSHNNANMVALKKIAILFLIQETPDISSATLMDLCLKSRYMNYLTFIELEEDIQKEHLASLSVRKEEYLKDAKGNPIARWSLTALGSEILNTLIKTVDDGILKYLKKLSTDSLSEEEKKKQFSITFTPTHYGNYMATFTVKEKQLTVFEFSILCPDKKAAESLCQQWKKDPESLYIKMMEDLSY